MTVRYTFMSGKPFATANNRHRLRAVLRGALCAAAAACAWPGHGPAWRAGLVPSLSPFNALLATAAGTGGLFLLGALAIAIVCAFRPRAFCRWICPAGTCQDAIACRVKRRRAWASRVPQIGPWLVLLGTGAALTKYPLFGWLDPLVLFNASFGIARGYPEPNDWLAAAGFPLLLIAALVAPGLWCGKVCPLGAFQDLLRFPFRPKVVTAPPARKEISAVGRRVFLGLGLGASYRLALPPGHAAPSTAVRPPASKGGPHFTRLCSRCGACVRTCPNGIIRFGGADAGWGAVLAPQLSFDNDFCTPTCTLCGQACPSGAIPRFTVKTKFDSPIGLAKVDESICLLGQNRECGTCVSACPYDALDLTWDPVNMVSRVIVNAKRCTGCGGCEYVCPAALKAIRIFAPGDRLFPEQQHRGAT